MVILASSNAALSYKLTKQKRVDLQRPVQHVAKAHNVTAQSQGHEECHPAATPAMPFSHKTQSARPSTDYPSLKKNPLSIDQLLSATLSETTSIPVSGQTSTIFFDPTNPEGSNFQSLDKLENGEFGPFSHGLVGFNIQEGRKEERMKERKKLPPDPYPL